MDANKRHELHSNELVDFLTNLPEYLKENKNMVIGAVLIVVGLISWPLLNNMKKESNLGKQIELTAALSELEMGKMSVLAQMQTGKSESLNTLLVAAAHLQEQAAKVGDGNMESLALIKRAQALRSDIHFRKEAVAADVVASQMKQAQEAYQSALDKARMPVLKAMAQFGLGLCSEESGQLDQAKDIYQKIVTEAGYVPTPIPAQAKQRLEALADNNAKFAFVAPPAAQGPVISVPQTPAPAVAVPQPAAADANSK